MEFKETQEFIMPLDAGAIAGQTAANTILHTMNALGGDISVNAVAQAFGQMTMGHTQQLAQQMAMKEELLNLLEKLKSGEVTLNRVVISDNWYQIQPERAKKSSSDNGKTMETASAVLSEAGAS
jgi:hypothetical protein